MCARAATPAASASVISSQLAQRFDCQRSMLSLSCRRARPDNPDQCLQADWRRSKPFAQAMLYPPILAKC